MTDLYAILGFSATARECVTAADVKKAYRQEALKWHPDKHPPETRAQAEAHFKDLAHAFEILSDSTKRRLYDQGGMAAVERGGVPTPPMPTAEEEFEAMRPRTDGAYGGSGRNGHRAQSSHDRAARRGAPFVFRDPFEIFDAVFRDMNRMMNGMCGPRHGLPNDFGFGRGGVFDDPFFQTPFGADPFFAAPFGGVTHATHHGGVGLLGRGGLLFGPSLLSAFDAGSMFAGPTMRPTAHHQHHPQYQQFHTPAGWSSSGTVVHGTSTPGGDSRTTTQMFSFSGPAGGAGPRREGMSVTVETRIENGQRVTRTVQRTYLPDGTVREEVSGPAAASAPPRVAPIPTRVAPPAASAVPPRPALVPPQPQYRPMAVPLHAAARLHHSHAQPPVVAVLSSRASPAPTAMRSATSGPGAGRVGAASIRHIYPQAVAVGAGGARY
jgi:hypothetical protein